MAKGITICDNLKDLKYNPIPPTAFTEKGLGGEKASFSKFTRKIGGGRNF